MKTAKSMFVVILTLLLVYGCEKASLTENQGMDNGVYDLSSMVESGLKGMKISGPKATGSVQFVWTGGQKGGEMGKKPEDLLAFFEFDAHEGSAGKDPKGEIVYRVTKPDSTLHREIRAIVYDVLVDPASDRAYFVAEVVSDSKGCGGNGSDGHDEGCSDGGETDEGGGCSDDTTHDGGCSHDDTGMGGSPGGETGEEHDEGGCSDSGTDEGGCSDSGTDEGGCSDSGTDEGGCSDSETDEGHPGSSDKGNPLSGKNCRTGQLIAVKVHDVTTPGTARVDFNGDGKLDGDGLTWKWFSPEADFVPSTDNIALWPHLCKKTIVAGNLVVHY